jgi:TrmH family RNA methyltransferase
MLTKNEIKYLKSLHQKKEREEANCFICEGDKLVEEAVNSNFTVKEVYISHKKLTNRDKSIEIKAISEKEMEQISGFKTPPGILAVVQYPKTIDVDFKALNKEIFLILDGINDPGNMGTILRNADWFGIKNVICSKNSVDIFNSKVIQSSMGSIFRVNVNYCDLPDFIQDCVLNDIELYAAVMNGKSAEKHFIQNGGLILGSESHGIGEELLRMKINKITIPKIGLAESLNVGVASGILLALAKLD